MDLIVSESKVVETSDSDCYPFTYVVIKEVKCNWDFGMRGTG